MSDPQANAEALDEEELPDELIPENFIDPEDWDAGAGADEDRDSEDDLGQEHEASLNAEDAAMHIERGISEGE